MMHTLRVKCRWILKFDTAKSCMNTAVMLSLDFMGLASNNNLFLVLKIFSLSVCSIKCKWKNQNGCFQDTVAHNCLAS